MTSVVAWGRKLGHGLWNDPPLSSSQCAGLPTSSAGEPGGFDTTMLERVDLDIRY